ncbi:alpha/beta hydrolase [Amorphoplanes nipponensis]|uniref:Hydrolase n=1 Tax=Actinoplanes nipponensis TaxID=135950 RepID=A0A919JID6_9ACTN|nr:alpha/beta hydrolase [Actinoplanes nipponensis]GIE50027.1 hydrolase [Actinoplanes nipponensis]
MPIFSAPDGTRLAYRSLGEGDPVICVPGGPMRDAAYLGDLGGLSARRRLIRLDLRGTGRSARPADPTSYRCDRLVEDLDALRAHLGLRRIDLLGHSAGTNLVAQYAARHPDAVARLLLITPSVAGVGVPVTAADRRAVADLRRDEPWYPAASAALTRIAEGRAGAADWDAIAPLRHGRWDDAARQLDAEHEAQVNAEAADRYVEGFTPDATRAALASFPTPVLLLAGEYDLNSPPAAVAGIAALFGDATLVVQPRAGHQPWLDDPDRFVTTVAGFLRTA